MDNATLRVPIEPDSDHVPAAKRDRRQHQRVAVTLLGRFMRENKQEHPCRLIDISVGGASLKSPVDVGVGERIVAYFDIIGGIEGTVVRQFVEGFAIELLATPYKREKLQGQITSLLNRSRMGGDPIPRRHERHALANKTSSLKLGEGLIVQAKVLDVSISGASIATDARPPIGGEIVLGKLRGRVVRHHDQGIGVEFIDIQNPEAVRRYFG
ncbi:MAG: PilZ domain-containing protein [Hyphomicrobiaceae bacterium]